MRTSSVTATDFVSGRMGATSAPAHSRSPPLPGASCTSILSFVVLLLPVLLAGAAPAHAAITHKLAGSFNEGGTLSEPGPIAVDTSTGSVYVVTGGSSFAGEKVEKFDASGNPANFSFLGTNSFEPCAFGGCVSGIAVDNSAGVNHGAIYIATTGNSIFVYRPSGQLLGPFRFSHVFQEGFINNEGPYCGVAVDSSGSFYVEHSNGFFEDGAYTDKFQPGRWRVNPSPPQIWPVAGVFQQPEDGGTCKISSDANQFLYTARGEYTGSGTLKRWPMSAVELVSPPSKVIDTNVSAFYADQANADIYSDETTKVTRFDSAGEPVEVFGDGGLSNSTGIAVNSLNGTVYVADRGTNDVKIYTAVMTPDITNISATTGQTSATVSAHSNSRRGGCHRLRNRVRPGTELRIERSLLREPPIEWGERHHGEHPRSHDEADYHYRVRASNANGTTRSIDRTFMTHAVAGVQALPASNITRTSATLNGSFSGNGEPTTHYFEWGTSTSYGNSTPESPPSSATGTVPASADLTGLAVYREDSLPYHYRLVATNGVGTTYGPDMTFHTLPPNPPEISNESSSNVTPSSAISERGNQSWARRYDLCVRIRHEPVVRPGNRSERTNRQRRGPAWGQQ